MVRLYALNECAIEAEGKRIMPDADIVFGMLLFLAAHSGKNVSRGVFTRMFWPKSSGAAGSGSLRQTLYRLKVYVPELETTRSTIVLPEDFAEFDFTPLVSDTASPADFLEHDSFRILPDYAPRFSEPFAEWVEQYREELTSRLRRSAMRALLVARMKGQYDELERLALLCLQLDPLNEEATLALAEATALMGNKARALRILDEYMDEVGHRAPALRLPAKVLGRRISERMPVHHQGWGHNLPLIGREVTLELLTRSIREANQGTAQSTFVWGEPGIGKTRVATRVLEIAALEGARTVVVRCHESDVDRPLSGVMELVQNLLNLPGSLGCEPGSLRILRRFTKHAGDVIAEALAEPETAPTFAYLRCAILDIFDAVLSECFLAIHLDDAQLLNASSWDVLREVIELHSTKRLAFIFATRAPPTSRSAPALNSLWKLSVATELRGLDVPNADKLLTAVEYACGVRLSAAMRQQCHEAGNGSPFFLCELARHYVSEGKADGIPHTLRSLLERRLTEISVEETHVFQLCAVLGESATFSRLERALELPAVHLISAISSLEGRGLVRVDADCVRPTHGMLVEVSRKRAATTTLKLLHRRAAIVLESDLSSSPSPALLWECAMHFLNAGESKRAFVVVLRLGQMLVDAGLAKEALDIYDRAADLCSSNLEEIDRLDASWKAARVDSQWQRVIDITSRLGVLSPTVKRGEIVRSEREFANVEAHIRMGRGGAPLLERALTSARDPSISSLDRLGLASIGMTIADDLFLPTVANTLFVVVGDLPESSSDFAPRKCAAEMLYHVSFGDLDEAVRCSLRLVALTRARSRAHVELSRALRWSSRAYMYGGLFAEAKQNLEESLDIASHRGDLVEAAEACGWLVDLSLRAGDVTQARAWGAGITKWLARVDDPRQAANCNAYFARLSLASGEEDASKLFVSRTGEYPAYQESWRARTTLRSMRVRTDVLCRAVPTREDVDLLLIDLEGTLHAGSMDECVLGAAVGVAAVYDAERASQLWSNYLRLRRERYPPPAFVMQFLHESAVELR